MSPPIPGLFPENKLVIATHNAGKVKEFAVLINHDGLQLISAAELYLPEPDETGSSFAENAALKSRAAALASNLPALADDSGLSVHELGGAPGIYSARWADDKNFIPAFQKIHDELHKKNIPPNGAAASFICALALTLPSGKTLISQGKIDGHLCFPARGENGFGYDPIFIPVGETRSFAELSPAEKNHYSHRARAVTELKKQF
jgi:XTP/dITP diphosphohydrolase